MRQIVASCFLISLLSACGLDVASTAATTAAATKQEIEEGQKTMEHVQDKVDAVMAQTAQRTKDADDSAK